jgi:hypothetical protein
MNGLQTSQPATRGRRFFFSALTADNAMKRPDKHEMKADKCWECCRVLCS